MADDQGMAELLNSYFCSVFSKDDIGVPPPDPPPTVSGSLTQIRVTVKEVREKIRRLKPRSAPGPDGIGPQLLQELEAELAPVLTDIFNTTLAEGRVPEDWKKANVTPIFKKGSKADPGNYRPVSLTSVPCKMLESVIKDRLTEHFRINKLILPSQHGFVANKSCTTNLLEFFEAATAAVDGGDPYDVIFLDFAKAFDTVPTRPLLQKLQAMGVGGSVLSWIRDWLTNRSQRVVLNGKASEWGPVTSGVPQGSLLGPVLFTVHINDVDLVVQMLIEMIRKFADDTKLGNSARDAEHRQALQDALDALMKWASDWGMSFNVKKCKVMHLGHNNVKRAYTMGGVQLAETSEERDIGVLISNSLKPAAQCAKAAATAARVLSQISRSFHYRDRHVFVRLYKQYVLPHLEFCTPAWSPWTAADKEVLEKVQRRAVAMISGLASPVYEDRLEELGMQSLEERRRMADLTQVYKIVHGKDDVESSTWFKHVDQSDRVTRSASDSLNLVQPRSRLDLRRNFFSNRVVEGWNNLPPDLKRAKNTQCFKNGYLKWKNGRRERALV